MATGDGVGEAGVSAKTVSVALMAACSVLWATALVAVRSGGEVGTGVLVSAIVVSVAFAAT